MKNRTGFIISFICGVSGFLLLFKVLILDLVAPADELAPGMVVIASVVSGVLFGFVGSRVQLRKKL